MASPAEIDSYTHIADLYDWVSPYRNRPDIKFYVDEALASQGPVLEIGCGSGRVLIPTAAAGIEIYGLDLSASMLQVCRELLSKETREALKRVTLVQADMRSFDLKMQFSLITIPFRPFQHLISIEDQLACLNCVRRHLAEGGRFIFDLFNPSFEALANTNFGEEGGDEPEFSTPDGRRVIRKVKISSRDLANQVNHAELIYYVTYPNGRSERLVQAFPMRYLFRFEAEHLLRRAGFVIEQLYCDFDRSPYGSKYPGDLIFIAKNNNDL